MVFVILAEPVRGRETRSFHPSQFPGGLSSGNPHTRHDPQPPHDPHDRGAAIPPGLAR